MCKKGQSSSQVKNSGLCFTWMNDECLRSCRHNCVEDLIKYLIFVCISFSLVWTHSLGDHTSILASRTQDVPLPWYAHVCVRISGRGGGEGEMLDVSLWKFCEPTKGMTPCFIIFSGRVLNFKNLTYPARWQALGNFVWFGGNNSVKSKVQIIPRKFCIVNPKKSQVIHP